MARCLVIGCGCRGTALAGRLIFRGHTVRGTTRERARLDAIAACGAEPVLADPDRVATLVPALDHVTLAYVLLGSAVGPPAHIAALHGERLEMLLTRMVDTTVRGIAYEAAGRVEPEVLRAGSERVRAICEDARIPYLLLDADPGDHGAWTIAAVEAVDALLRR